MNMKAKTNSFIFWKMILLLFIASLMISVGIPAFLSGLLTIPSLVIATIIVLCVRRSFRAFETTHSVSVPDFYKAVWNDKGNNTLQTVINELKSKEGKSGKNCCRTEEG